MTAPSGIGSTQRPRWYDRAGWQFALVAAVAGAIVLCRLGATAMDDHECKAALAGQGMARPGGWIVAGPKGEPMATDEIPPDTTWNRWMVPVNNGRPRLVKTPLPYWVIAGLAKLTGEVDEWTARAQSAISALLTALIVLALGRVMFRPRVALLGTLMFVTTVGFQKWGRNARPEMMLCLYMTAAMACFYMGLTVKRRGRRAWWMLAFWGAMALANLSKQILPLMLAPAVLAFVVYDRSRRGDDGQSIEPPRGPLATCLIGWAVAAALAIVLHLLRGATDVVGPKLGLAVTAGLVVLSLLWYAVTTRGYRGVWPLLPTAAAGAAIMFAAFVPWMLYMHELFPQASAVFGEQLAERAAGVGKWAVTKPQPYLVPLVMLTLPWLAFLPGAFAAPWLKCFADRRRPLVYLFLWSAGLIGMLILSAGKRDHYILPAIPAVCLLMGFVAEDVFFTRRWLPERLARRLGAGHGAAALAAVVVVAAMWMVAAVWGEGISRYVAEAADPSRFLLRLRDSVRWRHMLIVTALAAVPATIAMVASIRNRLARVPGLLIAAITVVYVGFHLGGPLWDDLAPVAEFARQAAERTGPDSPVGSWGNAQAKTVFYFGRDIHSVMWTRSRLVRQFGRDEGMTRWKAWMKDKRNVEWMFCYGKQVRRIRPMGYRAVLQVASRQKRRLRFTLLHNTGEP